jgi:hypothetical protein
VDPTSKGNILMFLGAVLALATFWLIVLGVTQASPIRIVFGVLAGALSVWVFRLYAEIDRG